MQPYYRRLCRYFANVFRAVSTGWKLRKWFSFKDNINQRSTIVDVYVLWEILQLKVFSYFSDKETQDVFCFYPLSLKVTFPWVFECQPSKNCYLSYLWKFWFVFYIFVCTCWAGFKVIFLLGKPLWVNVFVYIVHLFQGSFKVIDWDNEVQIDF